MSTPAPTSAAALPPARQALERRRRLLSILYLPWALGVFLPLVVVSMLLIGGLATLTALVSANAAWWLGKLWSRLVCLLNLTRVRIQGLEHVDPDQPYVYMLNHYSHFDVVAFYGRWRQQFRWVVKQELRKIPGLGWYCAVGGHVFVDRKNHQRAIASLEKARQRMQDERFSIAFFPEGTRSRYGRLQPFKKGGFVMARQLGLPILPVSISGTSAILPGKTLRLLPGRVTITVHPPIDTASYGDDQDRLIADTRAAIKQGLDDWERMDAPTVQS